MSWEKEYEMNVYALTDGSQTMAIYATEAEALAGAQRYMAARMWHNCQIRFIESGDNNFTGGITLFYEDCGEMVEAD